MGRDSVLPARFFGFLSERFKTPVLNIVLCGVIGLGAMFVDVTTSTSFVNFGAFLGCSWLGIGIVYLVVLTRGFRRPPPEMTTLGAEGH